MIEDKDSHVMDLNKHCVELVKFLDNASKSVKCFMQGKMRLSVGNVPDNAVLVSLTKESELDVIVEQFLTLHLSSLCKLFTTFFTDFLPGGKFHNPSQSLHNETTGVAKHNKFCETVFARTDYILR